MSTSRSQPQIHTPVLVGVGTAAAAAPVAELMTQAAVAAARDAGDAGLLSAVDRVAVPQGSWDLIDPGRTVASRIGTGSARSVRYEIGVSQQEVINDALRAIATGDCEMVLVVGAEDRAFARGGGLEAEESPTPPDEVVTRPPDFVAPIELAAGIVWPVAQQYALIENALAAAEQLNAEAQRNDIAALWSRFNRVAQGNPLAAFATPRSATDIATPGPKNRPLSFPYNVWHASQWTVDQGAALLFCSVEGARRRGLPADGWVFPHVALHSSTAITLTARRHLHRWPAMAVLGQAAETALGYPLRDLPLTEVYSCFPAAVRVQQRELGLNPDGTPTVTGGMTFAGGPFNNFVLNATAALVGHLRQDPGQVGLITTVSGMLSKPGLALWSCTPPAAGTHLADLGPETMAATEVVPVAEPIGAHGPATVVSSTVTYGTDDPLVPVRTAVVLDLPDGSRTVATCDNPLIAAQSVSESLIGRHVHVDGTTFTP